LAASAAKKQNGAGEAVNVPAIFTPVSFSSRLRNGDDHRPDRRRGIQNRGEAGADLCLAKEDAGVRNGVVDQAEQKKDGHRAQISA